MMKNEEILKVISDDEVYQICKLYKNYFPRTLHAYNLLSSSLRWRQLYPDKDYVTVMAPEGNWQKGTVFVVQKFNAYEVFIFTLEKSLAIIYDIITTTKCINWSGRMFVYTVHQDHYETISRALRQTCFRFRHDIPCTLWWMPISNALELHIDCPHEVYLSKLKQEDAAIINIKWPHRFIGSQEHISILIKTNGGYGVYLKSTNLLVAWVLRIQFGLGMLHVLEEYKRKGYGGLVAKALSKEIAQQGFAPAATVIVNNFVAQELFRKIGFRKSEFLTYIESKERDM